MTSLSPEKSGWADRSPLPIPLADPAGVVLDQILYIFGGYSFKGIKSDVYAYDPSKDVWIEKCSMPTSRWGACAAVHEDKIYVFGGFNGFKNLRTLEIYDPLTDSWSKGCQLPFGLRGMTAVTLTDRIHLIGGKRSYLAAEKNHWVYNPLNNSYGKKAPLLTPRGWAVSTIIEGRIYTIGGSGNKGIRRIFSKQLFHNANEMYDPFTDSWKKRAPCPISVHGAAKDNSAVDNKIFYAFGFNGNQRKFYSSIYCYDPFADSWSIGTPSSVKRDGVVCGVINRKMYTVGGRVLMQNPKPLNSTQEYNPNQDKLINE